MNHDKFSPENVWLEYIGIMVRSLPFALGYSLVPFSMHLVHLYWNNIITSNFGIRTKFSRIQGNPQRIIIIFERVAHRLSNSF